MERALLSNMMICVLILLYLSYFGGGAVWLLCWMIRHTLIVPLGCELKLLLLFTVKSVTYSRRWSEVVAIAKDSSCWPAACLVFHDFTNEICSMNTFVLVHRSCCFCFTELLYKFLFLTQGVQTSSSGEMN